MHVNPGWGELYEKIRCCAVEPRRQARPTGRLGTTVSHLTAIDEDQLALMERHESTFSYEDKGRKLVEREYKYFRPNDRTGETTRQIIYGY